MYQPGAEPGGITEEDCRPLLVFLSKGCTGNQDGGFSIFFIVMRERNGILIA